ncbi:MAG TPA: hypothetical protein VK154_05200 [Chitinophagales bacterium]|nr:hypothetical protein [Chitinophagales bacterium]
MRKYGCLLIALLILAAVSAQTKYVSLPLKSGKVNTYSYTNNEQLVYFIRDGKTLHTIIFDTALTVLKQSKYNLEEFIDKSEGVIAVTETNKKPSLFFSDKMLEHFSSISLDMNSNTLLQFSYPPLATNDYYLNSFSYDSKFFILTLKGENENPGLMLREYNGTSTATEHFVSLEGFDINKGYADILYNVFFEPNAVGNGYTTFDVPILKRVRYDEPNTNATANSATKCYLDSNQLVITLNNIVDTTQVITIDLHSFNGSFRKISMGNSTNKKAKSVSDNTFLIDKRLFYISASQNELVYKILDFEAGTTLQEYTHGKDEAISYKNGPFYRVYNKKESELSLEPRPALNRLCGSHTGSKIGLAVNLTDDGQYEVFIGNSPNAGTNYPFIVPYMYTPSNIALPMDLSPGMFFHLLLPSIIWNEGFTAVNNDYDNFYFKSHFRKTDLTYLSRENTAGVYFKLNAKVAELKATEFVEAVNVIRFQAHIMISYLHTDDGKFFIFKLQP